jgi:hypothetical protein
LEYDDAAYGATVYSKVGLGLWTLENIVGTEPFRRAMAEYLALTSTSIRLALIFGHRLNVRWMPISVGFLMIT